MTEASGSGRLGIEEDLDYQRREWRASSVIWVVLLLVMLATGLGLFGNGPLSRAHAGDRQDPLWVEYQRFTRFGAALRMTIHVAAQPNGAATFTLSRSMLEAFTVVAVTPAPDETGGGESGVMYRFFTDSAGVVAVFDLQPVRRWFVEGTVTSGDHAVQLRQFIYP